MILSKLLPAQSDRKDSTRTQGNWEKLPREPTRKLGKTPDTLPSRIRKTTMHRTSESPFHSGYRATSAMHTQPKRATTRISESNTTV